MVDGLAALKLENIKLAYRVGAADLPVLDNFSCQFEGGKIYVLMGPNGCGKSTLLKLITGELGPPQGAVSFSIDGCRVGPRIEYVPQNYREALFPWKTVCKNVWPWKPRDDMRAQDVQRRVNMALEKTGISHLLGRYPYELSGGQQQAILLARSVASISTLLVMDEPFSALDFVRRTRMSALLRDELRVCSRVVICAMHEPDEAATIADGVLFMNGPPLRMVDSVFRKENSDADVFRQEIAANVNLLAQKTQGVEIA
jgi:NitT/TauT family transport system ATP-binding protein